MVNIKETEQECCPKFDPTLWDEKVFEWSNKKFIKDKIATFFFMPLNFGSIMKKLDKKMRDANANSPEWLCLTDHTSNWNMNVYLATDKEIPDAQNTTMSGKFFSKVYEGPFQNTGKWCKDFKNIATSKGYNISKMLMWYTTCPKCAKKYGKNYVVIVSKLNL